MQTFTFYASEDKLENRGHKAVDIGVGKPLRKSRAIHLLWDPNIISFFLNFDTKITMVSTGVDQRNKGTEVLVAAKPPEYERGNRR